MFLVAHPACIDPSFNKVSTTRSVLRVNRKMRHSRILLGVIRCSTDAARSISTSACPPLASFVLWGSNTGVGKTLVSAALTQAAVRAQISTLYLKPVQTGFPSDCDNRLVCSVNGIAPTYGPHASSLLSHDSNHQRGPHGSVNEHLAARTLFAWSQPVSPHLAVKNEGRAVSDDDIIRDMLDEVNKHAWRCESQGSSSMAFIETAGGVASPGPSGNLQCDLYRAVRFPGVLVGDGRLGGISATLSSLDCLTLRGHDVPLVVLMETGLANGDALRSYLGGTVEVISLPLCAPGHVREQPGAHNPAIDRQLEDWLHLTAPQFDALIQQLMKDHVQRVEKLQRSVEKAQRHLWWPFTQHQLVQPQAVQVIDSRHGEDFHVYNSKMDGEIGPCISNVFDAAGSWWTQGMTAETQPLLARSVSYAAGRYGHVMFPGNVHEPALELAMKLLDSVGKGWAERVFYSDDGSTAIEVALKMAFRKTLMDHKLMTPDDIISGATPPPSTDLQVLGLMDSYHGDTLGAMDCCAPSVFNGVLNAPWYKGRGAFLQPAYVGLTHGSWHVTVPEAVQKLLLASNPGDSALIFPSKDAVFSISRDESPLADAYRQFIGHAIDTHESRGTESGDVKIGACIMEPVVQGAGGMLLVDPLFQRTLVRECRRRQIPVIFDEVFTGIWRLGVVAAAELLGVAPDIACYAKLLTGGVLPLSVTLASKDVFDSFLGPSVMHALLHGHSYTAHPLGCSAAVTALDMYTNHNINPNVCSPQAGTCSKCTSPCGHLVDLWDSEKVHHISQLDNVARVMPLGTVMAVELKPRDGRGGYASGAAAGVVKKMRSEGIYVRPLGNVVYVMCTPMTSQKKRNFLLDSLHGCIQSDLVEGMMCG